MRFFAIPVLALLIALPTQAADPVARWECMDTSGMKVVQDRPCADGMVEWHADTVPAYVWGIVAVLGLIWLAALMPQRLFRWGAASPEMPELLPAGLSPLPEVAHPAPVAPPPMEQPVAPAPAAPMARPARWSLEAITRLPTRRFEELVHVLWRANGYKPAMPGNEVWIHHEKSGRLVAIHCTEQTDRAVAGGAIQRLWASVEHHRAGLGVHYAPAGFELDALAFAEGKRLKLVSGAELLAQIRTLKPERQQALLDHLWR